MPDDEFVDALLRTATWVSCNSIRSDGKAIQSNWVSVLQELTLIRTGRGLCLKSSADSRRANDL